MSHVELFPEKGFISLPGRRRRWYWREVASNGNVVSDGGEAYASKWNAKRAARKRRPALEIKEVPS